MLLKFAVLLHKIFLFWLFKLAMEVYAHCQVCKERRIPLLLSIFYLPFINKSLSFAFARFSCQPSHVISNLKFQYLKTKKCLSQKLCW